MQVNEIGIATDGPANAGLLHQLETELAYYAECGFHLVELDPLPFSIIVHGELRRPQLENYVAVLKNFDFRYSMHGLERLSLAYDSRHQLCQQIMMGQLEICRAVGASRLVYHSGLQALDTVRHGVRRSLLTDKELAEGAQREVAALKKVAAVAADAGVTICLENGDPHHWEFDLMARFGRPRTELVKHQAWLLIEPIVRQLETIDHPNVAMTLDIAHLHIGAHNLEFDYLEAVEKAAPWVKHLHANDNFGHLDQGSEETPYLLAFGEADLHLPPGWGGIPYGEVFARLSTYEGDLILEIKPSFRDYFGEGLKNMKKILGDLN